MSTESQFQVHFMQVKQGQMTFFIMESFTHEIWAVPHYQQRHKEDSLYNDLSFRTADRAFIHLLQSFSCLPWKLIYCQECPWFEQLPRRKFKSRIMLCFVFFKITVSMYKVAWFFENPSYEHAWLLTGAKESLLKILWTAWASTFWYRWESLLL